MAKYHISKDGVARKCQAKTVEACRAVKSGFDEHYGTREEAQKAYENSMNTKQGQTSSLSKKKSIAKNSSNHSEDTSNSPYLQPILIRNEITGANALKEIAERNRYMKHRDLKADEKKFVRDFANGKIPSSFPDSLVGDTIGMGLHMTSQDVGYYAKITKEFAHNLSKKIRDDLGGKEPVVLDPMAGKGYFVKAMREQGVKTIGSDDKSWAKAQTDEGIEDLDAVESLKKHGNELTHLVMSWTPPYSTLDKKLYDVVRKDFPHITIINIGEDAGGCTGSEEFWDNIRDDSKKNTVEIEYNDCGYKTLFGVHDFVTFVKPAEQIEQ